MDICFSELREREIINVYDGKKLGRIVDVLFDINSGEIRGIIVPGDKKLFHKNDDIFVPLDKIKKIGGDVILVGLQFDHGMGFMSAESAYNYYSSNNFGGTGKRNKKNRPKYMMPVYENEIKYKNNQNFNNNSQSQSNCYSSRRNGSYVRFRRVNKQKYI